MYEVKVEELLLYHEKSCQACGLCPPVRSPADGTDCTEGLRAVRLDAAKLMASKMLPYREEKSSISDEGRARRELKTIGVPKSGSTSAVGHAKTSEWLERSSTFFITSPTTCWKVGLCGTTADDQPQGFL